MKGLMRTVMWTEVLEAMKADYPDVDFGTKSGPAMTRVINSNTDFMFDLSEKARAAAKEG